MRHGFSAGATIAALTTAGCTVSPDEPAALPDGVRTLVLDAAREYQSYSRVSDLAGWAPALCASAPTPGALASAGAEGSPHGRKLYYLYTTLPSAYRSMTTESQEPADPAPVGQTLVKEAWTAERIDAPPSEGRGPAPNHARMDGQAYRMGEFARLFLMLKFNPATRGTDRGWVYATVAPDRRTITSLGRVESCMACHTRAARDRQFGLPPDGRSMRLPPARGG